MKATSSNLPASRVVVDTAGGKTTVSLWDGSYETYRRTNDPDMPETGGTEYEYDLYLMEVTPRPGLAEAVDAQFDLWYSAAKKAEEDRENAAMMREMEKSITANMAETLLDYDFRLMMLEELGGMM